MKITYYAKCRIEEYDLGSYRGGYMRNGSLGSGCTSEDKAKESALDSLFNKFRNKFLDHTTKDWVKGKDWRKTAEYNEVLAALLDLITWSNDISENSIGYIHEVKANLQENHLMIINRAMGIA